MGGHHVEVPAAKQWEMPKSWMTTAIALMVVGLAGTVYGFVDASWRGWSNVLIAGVYFTGICLGAAFQFAVYSFVNGGWWISVKRIMEAFTTFLPVPMVVMVLIGLFGMHDLYEWSIPEIMEHDTLLQKKKLLLNETGWMIRVLVYFGIWMTTTFLMRKFSRAQDVDPDPKYTLFNVRVGAIHTVLFALTVTFAALDWLSSLEPHWFSTIFGVYQFIGMFVCAASTLILFILSMQRAGYLSWINEDHYHDLGKMMFAFGTFWAYIWVSQYLLIWYSNIPEETGYYIVRNNHGWLAIFFLNLACNWVIPFLVLLPRNNKRNPKVIGGVAGLLIFGHWLDLYLQVMPATSHFAAHHHGVDVHGPIFGLQEFGPILLLGGLFILTMGKMLGRAPLLARNDPYLQEALNHHQ
ncbi:MAG TPA: hypothetical protein DCQ06_01215 [Myxococcales bacterium]|nr:hypothetical protein [Myxococcales bacterium]HAN30192.1 hypothetical protein [Myxococcales bacterium]